MRRVHAVSLLGLVACGTEKATETLEARDAGPPPPCLQVQAVEQGQVEFQEVPGLRLTERLAVEHAALGLSAPATALPSGLDPAPYYGAVDPSAAEPWWSGWTVVDPAADGGLPGPRFHPLEAEIRSGAIAPAAMPACPAFSREAGTATAFEVSFPVCVLEDRLEADATLTADHLWVLMDDVVVGTGDAKLEGQPASTAVTLTIEPGTQVLGGRPGSGLTITRGSRLDAAGTVERPIVLAAVETDEDAPDLVTGDPTELTSEREWIGLALSGAAPFNRAGPQGEAISEYSPADAERWFAGNDPDDDSGVLRYVILAESGFAVRGENHPAGLLIEGVGRGTQIDYVQVLRSGDDCVGAFGGAADLRHVVCNGFDDDGLDFDFGFTGSVQHALVIFGAENGDRGIETDNDGSSFDAVPTTAPVLANITILGHEGQPQASTVGAVHREGDRSQVYRSVIADHLAAGGAFEAGCLDVDDVLPSELTYRDALLSCARPLVECEPDEP